jgi:hypothetical protein
MLHLNHDQRGGMLNTYLNYLLAAVHHQQYPKSRQPESGSTTFYAKWYYYQLSKQTAWPIIRHLMAHHDGVSGCNNLMLTLGCVSDNRTHEGPKYKIRCKAAGAVCSTVLLVVL